MRLSCSHTSESRLCRFRVKTANRTFTKSQVSVLRRVNELRVGNTHFVRTPLLSGRLVRVPVSLKKQRKGEQVQSSQALWYCRQKPYHRRYVMLHTYHLTSKVWRFDHCSHEFHPLKSNFQLQQLAEIECQSPT